MKEGKAYIGDEIVEGNKLIAEFDGFRPYSDTKTLGWLCPPGRVNQRYNDTTGLFDEELYFLDSELQYHSSWDWLIPAWNKFLSVADEVLGLEKNERYRNDTYRIFHNCIDNNNCERAAMFLVERITWYNQNKQS